MLNLDKVLSNNTLCIRTFGLDLEHLTYIINEVDEFIPKYLIGRKKKLDTKNQVLIFMYYLKNYCTFEKLGLLFDCSTSVAWRTINFMKNIFPKLKCLFLEEMINFDTLLVDCTITECERPSCLSNSIEYYTGYKKKFAMKTQVIVDKVSKLVHSVFTLEGSVHDYKVLDKYLDYYEIDRSILLIGDSGYCGLNNLHMNSLTVKKKPINGFLSEKYKLYNKFLSRFRVTNEHIIGKLKNFKIICGKFKHCVNILSTFALYFWIVSKIYNFSLIKI